MDRTNRDDRIFLITRLVLVVVNLALLGAFIILYLFPTQTRQLFAWEIKPPITAMFMGSGYISGAALFAYAIFGRYWHRVKTSFLAVTVFASSMLLATFLHYDRFIHTNITFYIWLIIYLITPFVVPWLWWRNRRTDPGTPEPGDRIVPFWLRLGMLVMMGILPLVAWILFMIRPDLLISIWVWTLTPLTARVLCSYGLLSAVGAITLAEEPRWSAWRIPTISAILWQALMVLASLLHPHDFKAGSIFNPFFYGLIILLLALVGLYAAMEFGARRRVRVTSAQV